MSVLNMKAKKLENTKVSRKQRLYWNALELRLGRERRCEIGDVRCEIGDVRCEIGDLRFEI